MNKPLIIALDVMGGDKAPDVVLQGAGIALQRFPQVAFLLYGAEDRIAPLLAKLPAVAAASTIIHTVDMITGDAKPSAALRTGKQSSMRLAIDAVADGRAHCVVSAGNTGALMAMAKIVLKTLPGISRPAIASFLPTMRGETVLLDLGANIECDADNLVQFALMGDAFARTVLGVVKPTIGLLNVGSEELKGVEAVREAASRLRSLPTVSFSGFVEGDDICGGAVDVIVTDGFTGNVALKTAEGAVKLYASFLRSALQSSMLARLGYLFAMPALNKLRRRVDPRRYNGAMLLGLNGIVVKSHGGSDALAFANAIGVAADLVINGFLEKMRGELAALHQPSIDPAATPTPATA
ncbi:MAG TPA: phosphate acyltransferase PlsX [Stellaceae bacterium]|nr:phosphate acyltransferase PlsX [Stellaceae bacterium]